MKSRLWLKQSRQENLTYLVVWVVLFAAPLLGLVIRVSNTPYTSFQWEDLLLVWRKFAVYLFLFILHNFLVAPLFAHKGKRYSYLILMTVIVAMFAVWQFKTRPIHSDGNPEQTFNQGRPPFDGQGRPSDMSGFPGAPMNPPSDFQGAPPPMPPEAPVSDAPQLHPGKAPHSVLEPDIMAIIMLVFMFAANVGIKHYYYSREDRQRIIELEKQNLEHQLEYLRFQINPHFLMNTLNNIHALIDINPGKAQETIVELSKMMRYILYEGERQGVPLTKEMEFIRTYMKLMGLRYSNKVDITLNLPDEVPDKTIPPLILISFIENAFKHGISYRRKSFVNIEVSVHDDALFFTCTNSKADVSNNEKGGVGLANVHRRLELLFPGRYNLDIRDDADTYTVDLKVPIVQNAETINNRI